jgi:hypothetical protein
MRTINERDIEELLRGTSKQELKDLYSNLTKRESLMSDGMLPELMKEKQRLIEGIRGNFGTIEKLRLQAEAESKTLVDSTVNEAIWEGVIDVVTLPLKSLGAVIGVGKAMLYDARMAENSSDFWESVADAFIAGKGLPGYSSLKTMTIDTEKDLQAFKEKYESLVNNHLNFISELKSKLDKVNSDIELRGGGIGQYSLEDIEAIKSSILAKESELGAIKNKINFDKINDDIKAKINQVRKNIN